MGYSSLRCPIYCTRSIQRSELRLDLNTPEPTALVSSSHKGSAASTTACMNVRLKPRPGRNHMCPCHRLKLNCAGTADGRRTFDLLVLPATGLSLLSLILFSMLADGFSCFFVIIAFVPYSRHRALS